ncbi:transposase [Corynebacterium striatum]|uniref:transposase n=1 Tax=Corynebacterium striatum TaxID=43770 RepID=UPI003F7D90E3
MAAGPHHIDPTAYLEELLTQASPDLMRQMLGDFINQILSAQADTVCGADYGTTSDNRVNQRNGYRHRLLDTRVGTVDVAIPKLRHGSFFPDWLLERRTRTERALTTVIGPVTTVGVDGTSSYGAGLTRHLRTQKYSVVEVLRPTRAVRRRDGKSDPVDAVAAARQVLTGEALSIPKDTSGPVESLRGLQITRRQLVMTAAKLMTTIKSLLVTAPDEIRRRYSAMSTLVMVEALSRCRPSADLADPRNGVLLALKTLATTYRDLQKQGTQLEKHISILVEMINPHVTSIFGCGSVVAADLIVSVGDNPGRIHSEAALAHLCGVAPIPASSGRTHRHRLNRGGDRRANSALHRIALVRMHHDQRTRDYVAKRTKEGLSKKEILRCLKRAIVREVYRVLCLGQAVLPTGQVEVDELKARRIQRQLSQAQVAEKLGCAPARISDIETGKRPLPELRLAYEELLKSA